VVAAARRRRHLLVKKVLGDWLVPSVCWRAGAVAVGVSAWSAVLFYAWARELPRRPALHLPVGFRSSCRQTGRRLIYPGS